MQLPTRTAPPTPPHPPHHPRTHFRNESRPTIDTLQSPWFHSD